jgi:hypothetical protein
LGLKLLWLAQASRSVPSTVKCSSEIRLASLAWVRTAVKRHLRDVALEKPVPVLREDGGIPDGVIRGQPDEPAEQGVVVQLLHELPLAPPDTVEGLQEQGPEHFSGGIDGRPVWEYSRAKRWDNSLRA